MPVQLKRLIPLFIIFIGLFLTVRHLLIPDSFGQYGHYRGDALIDNASKASIYATKDACFECHDDIQEMLENDAHAGLSCLICHGPGLQHVEDPTAVNIRKESGRGFCGRCHHLNAARPIDVVFQVDITKHHKEEPDCIDCHNPHQVWEGLQ